MQATRRCFSFVGKRPIVLEEGVTLSKQPIVADPQVKQHTHRTVPFVECITVSGPLGSLQQPLANGLELTANAAVIKHAGQTGYSLALDEAVYAACNKYQKKFLRSMWGLTNTLLQNMAQGVHCGWHAVVRCVGVGYKVKLDEAQQNVVLRVGFSHPVTLRIPPNIARVSVHAANTKLLLMGTDRQRVSEFAHRLRRIRKPNVYTGKGIYVDDETVKLKPMRRHK